MCQLPRRRLAVGRQFTLVLVDVGTWIRLCSRRWLSNIASQEQRIVGSRRCVGNFSHVPTSRIGYAAGEVREAIGTSNAYMKPVDA